MGKSNLTWKRGCLSAISLSAVLSAGVICPAHAQDADYSGDLLGNAGGVRTVLGRHGVTININDSENLLGNVSGGVKQGATMQGVTTATLEVDTGKAFGWQGGTFHISALQLHGQPLSGPYLANIQAANGNEGEDATRLWEMWYDQALGNTGADIKIGQQSIDNEFIGSQYSALFVNTMAGWPTIPSVDLYGGGPAYPLSSLGARVQFKPLANTTVLAGVFDDDPGNGLFTDDQQYLDHNGALFNLKHGALFIAEMQYAAAPAPNLPGTYKLGFWYDTGSFPDQRYDTNGTSLASPDTNGVPLPHHGNYSIYGVVDQTIWASKANSARTVNVFGRIMGTPEDQNFVDFSFNGGVTMTAPLPGRENDSAGIDIGIAKVSGQTAGLDEDTAFYTGAPFPKQGTETLVELTYQAQATKWLVLQPTLQYIANPGGGVQDPNEPSRNLRNELVLGVRAITTF
jgi:porin